MKICSFCNTENEDNAVKCVSCGANSFKYKCNNCGTVFADGVHCPHCGVKVGQQARVCPKCNTQYYSNACPTCGYVPNGSEMTATTPDHNSVQPVQPKRKTWLWVLGWIFIFPLPLTLILLKKPNMSKGLKYGIIIAAWVVYAIIAISGAASNSNDPKQTSRINLKETTVVTEAATAPATEKATEKATEAPTEAEPTEPPTEKATEAPTEPPAPTEAPVTINVYEYTDNVEAGSNAFVKIQGEPNTEYSIHVYYSTKESSAEGLENKVSDGNGYVTWEWKVGPNTNPGEHSITVKGGGASETVRFNVYN